MEISGRELNELSNVKMCQKAKYLYHVDVVGAQVSVLSFRSRPTTAIFQTFSPNHKK